MRNETRVCRDPDSCSGVSETIGTILLISLVVAGVSIIAVAVFSQPLPTQVPSLKFIAGINNTGTTLYIYHNGGDTLNAGDFSVLLDGVPALYNVSGCSGSSCPWSLGKNLIIPITTAPHTVNIVYGNTSMGGGVLINQAAPDVVSSGSVLPDLLPYLDCSAVRNWACANQIPPEIVVAQYQKNVTVQRINFMKQNAVLNGLLKGDSSGAPTYHFNFTVNQPNSSIVWGNNNCDVVTTISLTTGDKVAIWFPTDHGPSDFIFYGMAPAVWEMAGAQPSEISMRVVFANGTTYQSIKTNRLCHTWISQYKDLDSSLGVHAVQNGPKATVTSFIVNDTTILSGLDSASFDFENFRPINNGMFLISAPGSSQSPVFIVGWSGTIKINGVTQTGLGL